MAETLEPSDLIAAVAVGISLLSFVGTLVVARGQARVGRLRHIAELHQQWWSAELVSHRARVWELVEEHRTQGLKCRGVRFYDGDKEAISDEHQRALARVLFFFSDLNALIELKVVDGGAALRLFGAAQYDWFRPFISDARMTMVGRLRSGGLRPRWIDETEAFERKIDR